MPFSIMAIAAILCGILCLLLPETSKMAMPDTVKQVNSSGKDNNVPVNSSGKDNNVPVNSIVARTTMSRSTATTKTALTMIK